MPPSFQRTPAEEGSVVGSELNHAVFSVDIDGVGIVTVPVKVGLAIGA